MVGAIGPKRVDCHVTAAPLLAIYIFLCENCKCRIWRRDNSERLYMYCADLDRIPACDGRTDRQTDVHTDRHLAMA